jgi:hypothetical protein
MLIAETLRHLAIRGREGHELGCLGEQDTWQGKYLSETAIEGASNIARQFEVLLLVCPHRDVVSLVKENVGGLEDWVVDEAGTDETLGRSLLDVGTLVLELRHPSEITVGTYASENPCQFGVLRDERLKEECALGWIQATGQEVRHHAKSVRAKDLGIVWSGHRMKVDDTEDALVTGVRLEIEPELDRAKVVADVEAPGRLDARENAFFHRYSQDNIVEDMSDFSQLC